MRGRSVLRKWPTERAIAYVGGLEDARQIAQATDAGTTIIATFSDQCDPGTTLTSRPELVAALAAMRRCRAPTLLASGSRLSAKIAAQTHQSLRSWGKLQIVGPVAQLAHAQSHGTPSVDLGKTRTYGYIHAARSGAMRGAADRLLLESHGCDQIFVDESADSAIGLPARQRVLDALRPGDRVLVASVARHRRLGELFALVKSVGAKDAFIVDVGTDQILTMKRLSRFFTKRD